MIICTTDDTKTIESGVIDIGISDHSLVYVCRKIGIPRGSPKVVETRQFNKFNANKFQNDLRQAFANFEEYRDPDTALHDWNSIFLQIADKHAPRRSRRVKTDQQPWLTDEIKKLSYHRDYLKRKAVKLNSSWFHSAYKKCRNEVTKQIKKAKIRYFKTNLQNSKRSKESWKFINKLLNKTQKTTTINNIKMGEKNITDNEGISNAFNNFFIEVGPKLASNIPPSDVNPIELVRHSNKEFNFTPITKTELAAAINQLHINKAPGLDNISNKLIKAAGNAIHDSLLSMYNVKLATGVFPEALKVARVTPIYKVGNKSECEN